MWQKIPIIVAVALLPLSGCKKKAGGNNSPAVHPKTPMGAQGEELMSLDSAPPYKAPKKRKPSPRIKSRQFELVNATKEIVKNAPSGTLLFTAGDFTNEKNLDLLFVQHKKITIQSAGKPPLTYVGPAVPRLVHVFREKGKKQDSFFVAWGRGSQDRSAGLSLWLYRMKGNKIKGVSLYTPKTDRADVQDLYLGSDGVLYLAHFLTKYNVAVVAFDPPYTKPPRTIAQAKMITRIGETLFTKKPHLVFGRLYGDTAGSDGDLYVNLDKGRRSPLPSKRGVRALLSTDAVPPKGTELYVGDGWHKNYGQIARAHLSQIAFSRGTWVRKELDTLPNDFAILHLALGDLDGDGKPELIGKGNNTLVYWQPHQNFKRTVLAQSSGYRPIFAVDIDGDKRTEILLSEPAPMILRLRTKK